MYRKLHHICLLLTLRHVLHGQVYHVLNRYNVVAEYAGAQLAAQRLCPFLAQHVFALHHAYYGAHGRAVAVGVKALIHRKAYCLGTVIARKQQAQRHYLGVGYGVYPVVAVELVILFMYALKALVRAQTLRVPVQRLVYRLTEQSFSAFLPLHSICLWAVRKTSTAPCPAD